jgi:hypothetical protein
MSIWILSLVFVGYPYQAALMKTTSQASCMQTGAAIEAKIATDPHPTFPQIDHFYCAPLAFGMNEVDQSKIDVTSVS